MEPFDTWLGPFRARNECPAQGLIRTVSLPVHGSDLHFGIGKRGWVVLHHDFRSHAVVTAAVVVAAVDRAIDLLVGHQITPPVDSLAHRWPFMPWRENPRGIFVKTLAGHSSIRYAVMGLVSLRGVEKSDAALGGQR